MSDVLALLAELDKADKKTKPTDVKANTKKNAFSRSSSLRSTNTRQSRPTSLPPLRDQTSQSSVSPGRPDSSYSERPGSSYTPSLRKLSFADAPRPAVRRLRIPTRTSALPSGFPYDSRLFKYGVTAEEWNNFSSEIVKAAQVPSHTHVPALSWTWAFHKSKVIKGVKQQMLYESSDLNRELKRWNRNFKRQGFQVSLQLPNAEQEKSRGGQRNHTGDAKEEAKVEADKFSMVITPNAEKKPASIYSRSSSLTRTVTGEGAAMAKRRVQPLDMESEHEIFDGNDDSSNSLVESRTKSEFTENHNGSNISSFEPDNKQASFARKDESSRSSLESTPNPESYGQYDVSKSQPPRPVLNQTMFDAKDEPGVSKSEVIDERNDVNSPSPGQEMRETPFDEKEDSHGPPLELESKPLPDNRQIESTIVLPEESKSMGESIQEREIPHAEAEQKGVSTEKQGLRSNSKAYPKDGNLPVKSLNDLLTTAGGFDDWNNMDDD